MTIKHQGLFIGLMSGTSVDAVDVAITRIEVHKVQLVAFSEFDIPQSIKQAIADLSQPLVKAHRGDKHRIEQLASLDTQLGQLFAQAVNQCLKDNNLHTKDIIAIGSHGQTIRHRPDRAFPFSYQIGDPNTIAEKTNITTVADFRRADMAAGGQGAPLAPAFHNAILRSAEADRIILNLGGIANITYLPKDPTQTVIGFDTGPANTLMDAWFKLQHTDAAQGFDKDGLFALQGKVDKALLKQLLANDYFQRSYPKSTGREHFSLDWLNEQLNQYDGFATAADIQATLLELTSVSIMQAIDKLKLSDYQIFCCGGGAHNPQLIQALSQNNSAPIGTTNQLGVDGDYLESMCFAWLAYCRVNQLASNLPSVTGASKLKILGGIYLA
ncbi:MAG: anhydro-N-acetylmuramic acid kinase [Enterobacterales bacterium]|nr:anhydro-N-acetylmuramic acid kinase [Enterobacterales bacterium]